MFRCTGLDSFDLDGEAGSGIGIELARVRTPDEAVAFIDRFGPLGKLPEGLLRGEDVVRCQTTLKTPVDVREPLQYVLQAARDLEALVSAALDARRAAKGFPAAVERLTRYAKDRHIDDWAVARNVETRESSVSRHVAFELTDQMQHVRLRVETTAPGHFEIRILSDTLLDYCYVATARELASANLATCPECFRPFVVEDGRQQFCEKKCAGRARFRRFTDRKNEAARKGKQHGKSKTRPR